MSKLAQPGLLARLADIVGRPHVLTEPADMAPWLTDWRGRYTGDALAVVMPADTESVAAVVRECAALRIPVVPQGGNTGLCGAATPLPGGTAVVLRLARMSQILSVDALNNTLTAQAGCTLAAVQAAAATAGRFFPLSLASQGSCQIGGNLSTNAGGVQVLRYGNTRDLTLGLEVVLPDGRIWNGLRGLRKDNTGYDLKNLFIGAEGTLGVITAAVLKLYPQPVARATAWVQVASPADAVRLLNRLQATCADRVTAFELIGESALTLVLRHIPGARSPFNDSPAWSVLLELSDTSDDYGLAAMLQACLEEAVDFGWVGDAVVASSLAQAQALWSLRENISEAQRIEGLSIKHDISVPVSRIPEFIDRAHESLTSRWSDVRIVVFGHIGDGNLHYNLSATSSGRHADLLSRTAEANRLVHDLVDSLGGSISAEHGIGQLKRVELLRYKQAVEIDVMLTIKHAIDPLGIMNPGKLLQD